MIGVLRNASCGLAGKALAPIPAPAKVDCTCGSICPPIAAKVIGTGS